MATDLRTRALLLCTLSSLNAVASAGTPLDFFEVLTVTPSQEIKHEVDAKGIFDAERSEVFLNGPQLFSQAVGVGETSEVKAYLNWYKISQAADEPRRILSVRDSLQGDDAHQITIEGPAFLLSPAQKIETGAPSSVPDGLDYFKAYKILDAPHIDRQLKLAGTFGPRERTATRATYFCVPAEEWHHDDHFAVKNAKDCLVVYEVARPHKQSATVTTIDQFGLNTLKAESSSWVGVRAEILSRDEK